MTPGSAGIKPHEGIYAPNPGDGEFDGIGLQEAMSTSGWFYACRTAKSTVATWEGVKFNLDLLDLLYVSA
jgi:hypothetical protein